MKLVLLLLCGIVWVLAVSVSSAAEGKGEGKGEGEGEDVTIAPWMYCEGCKHTVKTYSLLVAKALEGRESRPPNLDEVCDGKLFNSNKYQPYFQYSCIKIMREHINLFREEFEGTVSIASAQSRVGIQNLKRKVSIVESPDYQY